LERSTVALTAAPPSSRSKKAMITRRCCEPPVLGSIADCVTRNGAMGNVAACREPGARFAEGDDLIASRLDLRRGVAHLE
jgi:hypothetical protein